MTLIELLVFLLLCFGLGFIGHLISPRWGWWASLIVAVPVVFFWLVGLYRQLLKGLRQGREFWQSRKR